MRNDVGVIAPMRVGRRGEAAEHARDDAGETVRLVVGMRVAAFDSDLAVVKSLLEQGRARRVRVAPRLEHRDQYAVHA
jgi:hypothetical protein